MSFEHQTQLFRESHLEAIRSGHPICGTSRFNFARFHCLLFYSLLLSVINVSASYGATLLILESEPGDFVGQGLARHFSTSDGTISANNNGTDRIGINFQPSGPGGEFWFLSFATPNREAFRPRNYENASKASLFVLPTQSAAQPGLSVSGAGRACNSATGRFVVFEAIFSRSGNIQRFAADFEQHCESSASALFGSVRFNSNIPATSLTFDAKEYFPLQLGNEWTYLENNSTSITREVVPGIGVNGILTIGTQDSDGLVTYYSNDSNGLRLHRQFQPNVDFDDGLFADLTVTYSPPIRLAAERSWHGNQILTNGTAIVVVAGIDTFTCNFSASSKFDTVENVSGPLGNFVTLKNLLTFSLTECRDSANNPVGPVGSETDTTWLARHIGAVRATVELIGEPVDTHELTSVTIDSDGDGINVLADNCPAIPNSSQLDTDLDGIGDLCDSDADGDSLVALLEAVLGTDQFKADTDGDGASDADEVTRGRNPLINEPAIIGIINAIVLDEN